MRGIKMNKERTGLLILTVLLSLAFAVSIVYATSASGWGANNPDVFYSIYVGNLHYDASQQVTRSDHSVYLYNDSEDRDIGYEYTFSQMVDWNHVNIIEGNGTLGPGGSFSESTTVVVGVGDLPANTYRLDAYTEIKFWDKDIQIIDDYRVDDYIYFNKLQ